MPNKSVSKRIKDIAEMRKRIQKTLNSGDYGEIKKLNNELRKSGLFSEAGEETALRKFRTAKIELLETSFEQSANFFRMGAGANGEINVKNSHTLAEMQKNQIKALNGLGKGYGLDDRQLGLLRDIENILKTNYTKDGLNRILRLTCGLKLPKGLL